MQVIDYCKLGRTHPLYQDKNRNNKAGKKKALSALLLLSQNQKHPLTSNRIHGNQSDKITGKSQKRGDPQKLVLWAPKISFLT